MYLIEIINVINKFLYSHLSSASKTNTFLELTMSLA